MKLLLCLLSYALAIAPASAQFFGPMSSETPVALTALFNANPVDSSQILRINGHPELTSLPVSAFYYMGGLAEIDLSQDALSSLPGGIFAQNTGLTSLRLRWNALTLLPPGIFDRNVALVDLHLAANPLTAAPSISHLAELVQLDLCATNITTLPAGYFAHNPLLSYIDLSDVCRLD